MVSGVSRALQWCFREFQERFKVSMRFQGIQGGTRSYQTRSGKFQDVTAGFYVVSGSFRGVLEYPRGCRNC